MKNISILGVTGSIGSQALDVLRKERDKYNLVAVSANSSLDKLLNIIKEFSPKYVAVTDKKSYERFLKLAKDNGYNGQILYGIDGLNKIASLEEIDVVLTSVVGMVGLEPTMKAIEAHKTIALANKETLVVAGELVMREAKKNGVKILPVDSEHSAIFQCLQGEKHEWIKNILLTASGGPFRGKKRSELENISPEKALKHPNWSMGRKITIDSATLMNKGLEVIEARWLFDVQYGNIKVIVHPQSIVHSMVEYKDGSILAQMGSADMKLPIQYALNYPERQEHIADTLDLFTHNNLTFEKPDTDTFKALSLAYRAGRKGGLMPTILNGANEECVDLFLNGKISFLQIADIVEECMDKLYTESELTLENILIMDKKTREYIKERYC